MPLRVALSSIRAESLPDAIAGGLWADVGPDFGLLTALNAGRALVQRHPRWRMGGTGRPPTRRSASAAIASRSSHAQGTAVANVAPSAATRRLVVEESPMTSRRGHRRARPAELRWRSPARAEPCDPGRGACHRRPARPTSPRRSGRAATSGASPTTSTEPRSPRIANDTSTAVSHPSAASSATTCSTSPACAASSRRSSPSPCHRTWTSIDAPSASPIATSVPICTSRSCPASTLATS